MPDLRGWQPVPAPRALSELPTEGARAHARELAGAWTLALLRSRPLDEIERLPLGPLAREAPALIEQLIAAVHSDAELERLLYAPPDAQRRPERISELAGAGGDPAGAVQALELLRAILGEALEGELLDPSPRQVADLYQRVAHVCAQALAAGLGAGAHGGVTPPPPGRATPGEDEHLGRETGGDRAAAAGALIVDELEGAGEADVAARSERGDEPPSPREHGDGGAGAIAIRDQRLEHAAVGWIAAIARQLERYEADRLPFAVLLVELREIEKLRLETPPAELAALGASLEQTLVAKLPANDTAAGPAGPWSGSLTPQRPGRCWLLAPETDRLAAHALADRLTRAVAAALTHGGRPLEVLMGVAVCPQDGRQAAALAAHADIDLHAARASRR